MKNMFSILLLTICSGLLWAEGLPANSSAIAFLHGTIPIADMTINVVVGDGSGYRSKGPVSEEVGEENLLTFDFPVVDAWTVSRSVYLSYTSDLPAERRGTLTFSVSPLRLDSNTVLPTTLVLTSESLFTSVRSVGGDDNAFFVTFRSGAMDDEPIGTMTVTVTKDSMELYPEGLYVGSVVINYSEE